MSNMVVTLKKLINIVVILLQNNDYLTCLTNNFAFMYTF